MYHLCSTLQVSTAGCLQMERDQLQRAHREHSDVYSEIHLQPQHSQQANIKPTLGAHQYQHHQHQHQHQHSEHTNTNTNTQSTPTSTRHSEHTNTQRVACTSVAILCAHQAAAAVRCTAARQAHQGTHSAAPLPSTVEIYWLSLESTHCSIDKLA